jgi:hypothetical protein
LIAAVETAEEAESSISAFYVTAETQRTERGFDLSLTGERPATDKTHADARLICRSARRAERFMNRRLSRRFIKKIEAFLCLLCASSAAGGDGPSPSADHRSDESTTRFARADLRGTRMRRRP